MKAGNVRASGPQVAAEVGDPLKRGAETEEEQQSATITPLLFQHRGGLTAVNSQKGHKNTHRHPDTHTHTRVGERENSAGDARNAIISACLLPDSVKHSLRLHCAR